MSSFLEWRREISFDMKRLTFFELDERAFSKVASCLSTLRIKDKRDKRDKRKRKRKWKRKRKEREKKRERENEWGKKRDSQRENQR